MGKHGKKQSLNHRKGKRTSYTNEEDEQEINDYPSNPPPSSAREVALSDSDQEEVEVEEENQETEKDSLGNRAIDNGVPSKFSLYQQSVQVTTDPSVYE